MAPSSVRDLVIHEDDVVAGTHGRSIWILDNITPLRQMDAAAAAEAFLFVPQTATRVRWNMFSDTPIPPEEPTGQNPPDGAIIDYYLKTPAAEVTLEILDSRGKTVRRFSSTDAPERLDSTLLPHPTYWIRPPQVLSTEAGMQRFVWDLRYAPPEGARRSYAIAAVYRTTPSSPLGPWVHPGQYTVRLDVDGQRFEQPLTVRLDPRVEVAAEALQQQHDLSMVCYDGYHEAQAARVQIQALRAQIQAHLDADRPAALKQALNALDEAAAGIEGRGTPSAPDLLYGSVYAAPPGRETLAGLQTTLLYLIELVQGADAQPTSQAVAAVDDQQQLLQNVLSRWNALKDGTLRSVNAQLAQAGLAPLAVK